MRIIHHGDIWKKQNQEIVFNCPYCGCKFGEHAYLCRTDTNFVTRQKRITCRCPECGNEVTDVLKDEKNNN